MEDDTCNGCVYAVPQFGDDEELLLRCRRYPPTVLAFNEEIAQTFPDANMRCGEFKLATTTEGVS